MKVFSDYAQYYDLLNQQKDYQKEVEYIIALINSYAPSTKHILDLGCGTGIHAINLAKAGYQVTGLDQSKDMITIATERSSNYPKSISDLLNFYTNDIRSIDLNKKFDTILSLFHVISYLITNEDINSAFRTISNHLKPDGIFIFDCWYGPAVLTDKPYERTKKFKNKNLSVIRNAIPQLHPTKNRVDVKFEIEITNNITGGEKRIEETHKMRYLFNPEIEMLLQNNSLKLLRAEEWLSGNEPSFDSWYVTFICQKI